MAQDRYQRPSSEVTIPQYKMASDHKSLWSLKRWFGKDGKDGKDDVISPPSLEQSEIQRPGVVRRLSRKVVPGLPRPGTFRRQQSELRDKLEPTKPEPEERRTVSVDRKGYTPVRDVSRHGALPLPRTSAPVLMETSECVDFEPEKKEELMSARVSEVNGFEQASDRPPADSASLVGQQSFSNDDFDDDLLDELEKRWILNLSMHFRDRSNREKFFVTFAEAPNRWRRVTISLDYRNAPPGSLEEELQNTKFQRDKSARIYESIRESLPDIQFYDTVTNLKLQTEHDRLHVHVTEDIHEVINYPSVAAISHLPCRIIREDELVFDSHLSGFVYKVSVHDQTFIKKEIPGPDTVEEFLYEINALFRLSGSDSVIQFGGVIVDNDGKLLKGLLISYAEKGALIDIIFDHKGELLWKRRERWAKQIVQGLSEIHEAGFVQGDFTLSNIVIDGDDRAKIIDINRRGCPVGWEPPEVAALIESKQRISMYIGVKSDLFQLGMVLWAIAMEQDEPETQPRPLTLSDTPEDIPSYYCNIVSICLSDDPRNRYQAARLLTMFPDTVGDGLQRQYERMPTPNFMETEYIDPATAVERDDIENFRALSSRSSEGAGNRRSSATHTYVNALTDISGEPYYYPTRGRSPPPRSLHETPISLSSHGYSEHNKEAQVIDYSEVEEIHDSRSNHDSREHNNGAQAFEHSYEVQVGDNEAKEIHEPLSNHDRSKQNKEAQEVERSGEDQIAELYNEANEVHEPLSDHYYPEHNIEAQVVEHPNEAEEAHVPLSNCDNNQHGDSRDVYPQNLDLDRADGAHEQNDQPEIYQHDKAADMVHELLPSYDDDEHSNKLDGNHDHPKEPKRSLELISNDHGDVSDVIHDSGFIHDNPEQEEESFTYREYSEEPAVNHKIAGEDCEPRVVDVSPSNDHYVDMRGIQEDSTIDPMISVISTVPEKPLHTDAAPEAVPEELAGIGQHSTLEHSNIPRGMLDDDLTTDMQ